MENYNDLANFMGGPAVVGSPKSDFEFIPIIRAGLPSEVIGAVVKSSAISEEVLCKSLHITARHNDTPDRLKPVESELIYRFSKALVTATTVLGDKTKAREWLLTENRALRGNRPIDLLDTAIGFDDVMDVLQRIDYGVYS